MIPIEKVAVIGAGVMGSGIAAQVANAGVPVVLLDIVPDNADNRNIIAETALANLCKREPAAFMSEAAVKLVTTGNITDHLGLIADCDWIIEAVIEQPDIKRALYARIDKFRKPHAIVSSNTSTIPLRELTRGASSGFSQHFLITHFFNPPRHMRLLEVVTSDNTSEAARNAVTQFADTRLGKSIVNVHDRPGFIGNRLGLFWLQTAVHEAISSRLGVEEVDAIMGAPMGIPKTGVFGLLDLIGLDLMPHINSSMSAYLSADDPYHQCCKSQSLLTKMIREGQTGRKSKKGGFYRLAPDATRTRQVLDLVTGEYTELQKPKVDATLASGRSLIKLLVHESKPAQFAATVMTRTLAYAAALVGEVAGDIASIDEAMRLGFNWKFGPFELIDQIGSAWLVDYLQKSENNVPPFLAQAAGRKFYRLEQGKYQMLGLDLTYHDIIRPPGVLLLEDIKRSNSPVISNASAAVWDIGDGVACFEFTSRMNALDEGTMDLILEAITLVQKQFKALVIYNEGPQFSVGANLNQITQYAASGEIENLLIKGQQAFLGLRYAPFPVVAAPAGLALGGGCEILLAADAVQAYCETYAGLVEVLVGLIPAWGGTKEMLRRWTAVNKAYEQITQAKVSNSAAQAKEYRILNASDGITMNRNRLLADAKSKALALVPDYQPPKPVHFTLAGAEGLNALESKMQTEFQQGKASAYDLVIFNALAQVLCGDDVAKPKTVTEDELLLLERKHFMALLRNPETLQRISHMLAIGKPLHN